MSHTTSNDRIDQIHRELVDIVDDPGMAARLPQALLDRLKVMRGMLLEELNIRPAAAVDGDLLSAERSQDANPERCAAPRITQKHASLS